MHVHSKLSLKVPQDRLFNSTKIPECLLIGYNSGLAPHSKIDFGLYVRSSGRTMFSPRALVSVPSSRSIAQTIVLMFG